MNGSLLRAAAVMPPARFDHGLHLSLAATLLIVAAFWAAAIAGVEAVRTPHELPVASEGRPPSPGMRTVRVTLDGAGLLGWKHMTFDLAAGDPAVRADAASMLRHLVMSVRQETGGRVIRGDADMVGLWPKDAVVLLAADRRVPCGYVHFVLRGLTACAPRSERPRIQLAVVPP